MASEAAPPPPPPPPPPTDEAPVGPATTIASSSSTAPTPAIDPTTLTSACTALERLRSLNAEQQACALLASSLLAHPLGASGTTTQVGDDGEMQVQHHPNVLKDPLLPSALAGGVRDAWAALSKAARPLHVLGGEVDDLDDDTDGADATSPGSKITPRKTNSRPRYLDLGPLDPRKVLQDSLRFADSADPLKGTSTCGRATSGGGRSGGWRPPRRACSPCTGERASSAPPSASTSPPPPCW